MLRNLIATLVFAAISLGGAFAWSAEPLKLTAECRPASILPLQTMRLQAKLTTNQDREFSGLMPLDQAIFVVGFRPSGVEEFRKPASELIPRSRLNQDGLSHFVSPLRENSHRIFEMEDLKLAPQKSLTLTFPLNAEISEGRVMPLFAEAGSYTLKLEYYYPLFSKGKESPVRATGTCEVVVRKPTGEDARVWETLRGDEELAAMITSHDSSLTPTPGVDADPAREKALRQKLLALAERYPKSAYADYIYFALARGELNGLGGLYGLTVQRAAKLPPETRKAALAWLEKIKVEEFPQGAIVLVLRRLLAADAQQQQALGKELEKLFPDSLERAEDEANREAGLVGKP